MEKPLRRPALNEAIRNYVKQYILDKGLAAGDPLPSETQLGEMMGVGRSSVREAIKGLESLGIVEVRHGEGLYVREYNFDPVVEILSYGMRFDSTTLAELIQIRIWLETALIQDVALRIEPEEIADLEQQIGVWRERIRAGQPYVDLDEQFHRTLYRTIKNRILIGLLDVFWVAFEHLPVDPDRDPMLVLEDHIAILSALKAHDPAGAQQSVLRNLRRMQGRILMTMT